MSAFVAGNVGETICQILSTLVQQSKSTMLIRCYKTPDLYQVSCGFENEQQNQSEKLMCYIRYMEHHNLLPNDAESQLKHLAVAADVA